MAKLLNGMLAVCLTVAGTACVKRVEIPTPMGNSTSVAPALVVEQFLRAANAAAANDTAGVNTMGRLFGTREGPVTSIDSRAVVEQRMVLLATILKHDDYKVQGEQLVPGRLSDARQLNVEMTIGPRKVVVPFVMVRSRGDNWLVEEIIVQNITYKR